MRYEERIPEIALSIALCGLVLLPFTSEAAMGVEGFVVNKGQIHDQFRKPNTSVLYLLEQPGLNVQLKADGFAYDMYSISEDAEAKHSTAPSGDKPSNGRTTTYDFHRIDLRFVDPFGGQEIIAQGEHEDYTNHYTDITGEGGITHVRSYSTITYRNVWPHIDVQFNSVGDGFKYDVIVRPGGDVSNVRFRVAGAELSVGAKGRLLFNWSDGTMEESIPASWFEHAGRRGRARVTYTIEADGIFGFSSMDNGEGTLVIDPTPTVEWATLYGGSGTDIAIETGMDALDNVYLAGHSTSASFIATAGAYDATYSASQDAYLVKFNSAGVRQYGTFLGGAGSDITTSIAVGANGITYVGGYTNSTSGVSYPNYEATHQYIQAGGQDGFIAQFNDAGQLIWCTYYGGSGDDRIMSMAIGPDHNLSFCGNTGSTNNISGAGAADGSYGGAQDGFLGRMAASGVKLWSTYLGGAGSDSVNDICYAGTNAVAVTGVTSSSSGISKSWPGVHDLSFNAGTDAFVARFEENGQKTWCSYYGGAYDDSGQSIAYVGLNQLVIAGTTWSLSGIATAGAVQTVLNEYRDGFLASLTVSNGIRTWGTYYGFGMQQESLGSIAAAGNGSFYVSGVQRPYANNAVTSRKFLLSYLNTGIPDGQLDLLTTGNNDQTSLSAKGTMLLATVCLSSNTPSFPTPGAHQTVSVGGTDAGLIELAWSPAAMGASPEFEQRANLLRATLYHGHIKLFHEEELKSMDRSGILGLLDATGREVLTTSWPARTPAMELDANLPPGTYVAVLRTNEGERTWGRFVIP
jgi:hypothetical protein